MWLFQTSIIIFVFKVTVKRIGLLNAYVESGFFVSSLNPQQIKSCGERNTVNLVFSSHLWNLNTCQKENGSQRSSFAFKKPKITGIKSALERPNISLEKWKIEKSKKLEIANYPEKKVDKPLQNTQFLSKSEYLGEKSEKK